MKNKLPAFGFILLVIINVTALVTFAYQRWVRPQSDAPSSLPASRVCLEESLSLNGTQKKCLKDIRLSFGQEADAVQARLVAKRKALVDEIKSETPDMSAVGKLIEDISRLQAEIQKMAVSHLIKEKQVLTPEQQEVFFRLFENHVCAGAAGGGEVDCPHEEKTDSR